MADDNISNTGATSEMDALDALWGDGTNDADESGNESGNDETVVDGSVKTTDGSQSFGDDETEDDATTEDSDADTGNRSKSAKAKSDDVDAGDEEPDGDVAQYPSIAINDVKAKYPKIFQEFPGLKQTLLREQKYTEVFPTLEHAEVASKKAETFDSFDQDIMSGSPDLLLTQLYNQAQPIFEEFTGRFLDKVKSVDGKQYNRIVAPIIGELIKSVYAHGIQEKNEDIQNSAQYFAKILFNRAVENIKVEKPYQEDKNRPNPEKQQFENDRREFAQKRFESSLEDINDITAKPLEADILKTIDPKDERSDLVNKQLAGEIMNRLYSNLNADTRFMATIKGLWQKAERANYSKEWMNRISSTWTARARTVVKGIRAQVLQDASKKGRNVNGNNRSLADKNQNRIPTGRAPSGNGNRGFSKAPNPKQVDYSKTTDEMLLSGRFVAKK